MSLDPCFTHPPDSRQLFKLFSHEILDQALLDSIFQEPETVALHDWHKGAYPVFEPPERFAPFQLAPGLVYLNAWENAASAMEMSAVSAANGAALVLQHLRNQQRDAGRRAGQLVGPAREQEASA